MRCLNVSLRDAGEGPPCVCVRVKHTQKEPHEFG